MLQKYQPWLLASPRNSELGCVAIFCYDKFVRGVCWLYLFYSGSRCVSVNDNDKSSQKSNEIMPQKRFDKNLNGLPYPGGLLRRRLSAPEIIMRKWVTLFKITYECFVVFDLLFPVVFFRVFIVFYFTLISWFYLHSLS